jgi:hypothetical protein
METAIELRDAVKGEFPEIAAQADIVHIKQWDSLDPQFAYSWFESLAKALNAEMLSAVGYKTHASLFNFINTVLSACSKEVFTCIDVALVENLFWRVPSASAAPYWHGLPSPLKKLYIGFHGRTPL